MAIQQTIRVTADTSQAKANLQELQSQLKALQSIPISADVTGLQAARQEINQLSQSLQTAMNPNTGKLDLSVFSNQLTKSGKQLSDYKNTLFSMGAQGQQAFLSLANAIATAEAPTNRLNQKVLQFGRTLKNTINWQISSSLVHGVVGQVQKAINYAEKLNQSLNNIQIVTGQNNEKMAEFAHQANLAAKRLSTTTTEYTNASLIYYQQGLSDKEVAARTETTVKLANVTRQSAQTVSDQMTAIWNNYAEGSENLEHYADVITALGAATASSSAEIAGGLEKFAAVSKTVGLSYNYATTALATIVATTRQSEDTVGTGLRTIFSRLQSLKLGETLEDGVGLTKYSAALQTVGVNILDSLGHIKDMDQILEELGAKWQTISREQQIALAQTVGGVRQYTNLMALMNNWDKFQKNLKIAEGADGTLETQAERYASSWEGARKRVQTSAEGIYDSLIDDQAMIKVTNVFASFLDIINGLVGGFNGLKGIIPVVSALLMNSFAKNAPQFVQDMKANFNALTGRSITNMSGIQNELGNTLTNLMNNSTDPIYKMQLNKILDQNSMNQSLLQNARRMSDTDQAAYRLQMESRGYLWDAAIKSAQEAQQKVDEQEEFITKQVKIRQKAPTQSAINDAVKHKLQELQGTAVLDKDTQQQIDTALHTDAELIKLRAQTSGYTTAVNQAEQAKKQAQSAIGGFSTAVTTAEQKVQNAEQAFNQAVNDSSTFQSSTRRLQQIENETRQLENERLTAAADRQQEIDDRIRELNREYKTESKRRDDLFKTDKVSNEESVEQARVALNKANDKLIQARSNLTEKTQEAAKAEAKYNAANKTLEDHKADIVQRENIIREEALRNRAEVLGREQAENDAGIPAQKDFLKDTYEKAGILTSSQDLLKSLGWEFNQDGSVKTTGKALTAENLQRQLTTQEQAQVNQATKAILSNVTTTAQDMQKFVTSGDLLKGSQELLKADLKPDLLQRNAVNSVKSLQSFGPELLKTLGLDKLFDADGFKDLDENGIWGKIADKLQMDPNDVQGIANKLSKMFGDATDKAADQAKQKQEELNQAEKDAIEQGGATKVQDVTGKAQETQDANMRSEWLRQQTSGIVPGATVSKDTITTTMEASSALMMMVSTMNTTANNFNTILDSSANGAEKFGAVLSEAASLLMTFALVTKLANNEQLRSALQKKAESGTGLVSSAAGKILGTSSGWIGLIITAVMAGIGIIKGIVNKVEQNNAAKRASIIESGQAKLDELTESRELRKSQNTLINAYKAAARAVEEGTGTQQQLNQARQDLVDSLMQETKYGSSNKNAIGAAYAGNTAMVEAIMDENIVRDITNTEAKLKTALKEQGLALEADTKAQHTAGFSLLSSIASVISPIAEQYAANHKGIVYSQDGFVGQLLLNATASTQDILAFYDMLAELQTALENSGYAASEMYSSVTAVKSKLSTNVEKYRTLEKSIKETQLDKLVAGGTVTTENGSFVVGRAGAEITDIASYNTYRDKLIQAYALSQGININAEGYDKTSKEYLDLVDMVDAVLGIAPSVTGNKLGNLQQINEGLEGVIAYQKKRHSNDAAAVETINGATYKTNLTKLYEEYGDALFEIGMRYALPVNLDIEQFKSEFSDVFNLLEKQAEANKIQVQIEFITNLGELAADTDIKTLKNVINNIDKALWKTIFGEDFDINSLMAMSPDDRAQKLNDYQFGLENLEYENLPDQIKALTDLTDINGRDQQNINNARIAMWKATAAAFGVAEDSDSQAIIDNQKNLVLSNQGVFNEAYSSLLATGSLNDEWRTKLSDIGLAEADITPDKIRAIHTYLDAVTALNDAETTLAEHEKELGTYQELLKYYEEFGWRLGLVKEANELGIDYNEVQDYANALRDANVFAEDAIETSERFALAIKKQEKAIEILSSNIKTWSSQLKELGNVLKNKGIGYTTAMEVAAKGAKKALAALLDVDASQISDDFIANTENIELMEMAANGSEDAILALGRAFAKGNIQTNFLGTAEELDTLLKGLQQDADGNDLKINVKLETSGALDDLVALSQKSAMTAEQISDNLSAAGWKPKISYMNLPITSASEPVDGYSTVTYEDSNGVVYTRSIESSSVPAAMKGEVALPVIDSGATTFKGSGGGGNKGGGGGGKPKPHKQKRYRVIENKIQDNNRKKEETKRDKERAFGLSKIDLLKQERELEKENLQLEQQYLSEIDDWLGKDKQDLIDKMSKIGFTPEFDAAGIMLNMDEFEAAWAALADGSDEAWTEAGEALDQYQETLAKYKDKLKELEEIQQTIFDSLLEEVELEVTLKLDVSNDRLEYIDYLLTKIDDDAYQAAEAIALLGEKTGETMAQAATYASGIEEILSHHKLPDGTTLSLENIGNMSTEDLLAANFTQDEIDKIREWRSSLLQANESLLEMRKTITDKLISAFEDLNEKVQRSYELFDHYNTTLEHYKNITDLIAKGNSSFQSRAALEALNRSSFTNSVNQLTAAKRILDDMPRYLAEAEQQYQDALASGDRNRIVQAERYLQTIQDREQEAREQWEEAWESSLESAQSFFEFTMENIAKDYEDTMSGMFGTLDYLQQAYERHKEDAEWYLESYDSLYQLGKLSRDISRAIDDTDSIRIKQRYRDLQAEINKLQKENAELTQHDVDMLQREFELELARAALEEAKNAKTRVRLQRDSEGNWGYVYTADEDKVNDALDKYAEALHAFQQTNHEYFAKIQDDFMNLLDVGTQITDIMSDLDLTPEEALANIEDLMKSVLGDDGRLQRLLDDLKQANADEEKIRELFTEIYGEDAVNNWLTFDDTLLKDLLNVDNIEDLRNLLTEAYEAAIQAGKEAREQLATDVGTVSDAAGVSVEDFGDHVHGLVQHLDAESLAAIQSVDDLATAMNTTFAQAMQQALQWEQDYADQMANVIAQNEAFVTSIDEMIEALSGMNGIEFYTRVNGITGSAGQAKFESFDSGGYTGVWGTHGRLAVLHEKEQIFNQDDTARLLNAAQILRTLDMQAMLASQGLGKLLLPTLGHGLSQTVDQNVTITAEFPNATNHSEIEEAFNNLINKASQYANRRTI